MPEQKLFLIFSGNRAEFLEWQSTNRNKRAVWVNGIGQVMGIDWENVELVTVGTYHKNPRVMKAFATAYHSLPKEKETP